MALFQSAEIERGTSPVLVTPTAISARSLLTGAFYHKGLILFAALIPVILSIIAAVMTKPEYTASSLLMVLVTREYSANQNVTDSGPAVLSIEGLKSVEAEVQIIQSADVILKTIDDIGRSRIFPPRQVPFPELLNRVPYGDRIASVLKRFLDSDDSLDDLVERFRARLRTIDQSGSNVILVAFTHPDRRLAIEITDEIVANYLQKRRQIFNNPISGILNTEVSRIRGELTDFDGRIENEKRKADVIDITQDALLATNQVDSIVQRKRQVLERRAGVGAQLEAAVRQISELPAAVFDFRERSDAAAEGDDRGALTRLLIERDRIAAQYSPGSAAMREIDQKIATVRQQLRSPDQRAANTDREVRNPAVNYLNNLILNLRVEQNSLGDQIAELDKQMPSAESRVADLRVAETKLAQLDRERATLTASYNEYLRRAVAAQIEETAADVRASNVRTVQSADTVVVRRSLQLPFIAAGLLGGVMFGMAAGAAAAVVRASFIHPDEAQRVLQLPSLAEFGRGAGVFESRSGGEAISALAAQLVETRIAGERIRALQFISPDDRDDVGTFGTALATELSTAQDLRILLIDDTPAGQDSPSKSADSLTVQPTSVSNFWRAEGTHLSPLLDLRSPIQKARQVLAELSQRYDMVLIFTEAPDMTRASQRLAPLVDGNVIMIRAERTRSPVAVHLRNLILESGGGLLGFIFLDRRYYIPGWIYRRI